MNDDRVRDLMKGFGDPVVPAPDEQAARAARSRALPRLEASLRNVAAASARRIRTRRLALFFGVAAALVLGVASAAVLSSRAPPGASPSAAPEIAVPVVIARAPASVEAPAPETKDDAPKGEEAPAEVAPPPQRSVRTDVRTTKPPETSTLSDQNRLLAAALDARRRNDDARALAHLNELLQKYPGSPLAEEARIERVRCLERLANARKPKP